MRPPPPPIHRTTKQTTLLCCSILIAQLLHVNGSSGYSSHHNRRYATYDYDLTTPQFTPDGRLLQVEYATTACRRDGSNPIVSVGVGIPSDELFGALRRRSHQQQQQFDDVQLDTSDVEPDGHTEGDTLGCQSL